METYSLYNDTIELVFDPAKHLYTVDGAPVDGVTTVLKVIAKPALVFWSAKMAAEHVAATLKPGVALDELEITQLVADAKTAHRRGADKSANLGSLAHSWFEDYFLGKNPSKPFNPDLRNMTEAFLRFAKTHEVQPLTLEKRLYSPTHRVAGTADLTCMVEGQYAMADYKTGKSGIYPEHFIQMGAYDICLTEEQEFLGIDKPINQHIIINANAKGELFIGKSKNVEVNKNAFRHALGLGRALTEIASDTKSNVERIKK